MLRRTLLVLLTLALLVSGTAIAAPAAASDSGPQWASAVQAFFHDLLVYAGLAKAGPAPDPNGLGTQEPPGTEAGPTPEPGGLLPIGHESELGPTPDPSG